MGFSDFFGGSENAAKTVDTAVNSIVNGIDKAILTKEEVLDFVEKTFDENSIRNVTRRWLAWGIVGWTLVNAQIAVIAALMGHDDAVDKIIGIASAFQLGWAFVGVIVAYFGVQFLRAKK
ncbi:MAG: hypothetical protein ACWGQW_08245 [bacterium]